MEMHSIDKLDVHREEDPVNDASIDGESTPGLWSYAEDTPTGRHEHDTLDEESSVECPTYNVESRQCIPSEFQSDPSYSEPHLGKQKQKEWEYEF